jgi:Tfp pilus assembly protein PilO
VRRFTPKEEVQQDFYSGKPIEIEVSGTYNNLGSFFAQMAAYQRIVSITDFKVTKLKSDQNEAQENNNKTIDAQFLITAYYVSPDKLQGVAPAQPAAANTAQATTAAVGQAANAAPQAR